MVPVQICGLMWRSLDVWYRRRRNQRRFLVRKSLGYQPLGGGLVLNVEMRSLFFITWCSLNSRHNNAYFPCSKTRRGFAVARWPVFGTQMGDFCGDSWANACKSESQPGAWCYFSSEDTPSLGEVTLVRMAFDRILFNWRHFVSFSFIDSFCGSCHVKCVLDSWFFWFEIVGWLCSQLRDGHWKAWPKHMYRQVDCEKDIKVL